MDFPVLQPAMSRRFRFRSPSQTIHLESAAFVGHMAGQDLSESLHANQFGHCEPRVLKPRYGGFWLALSANSIDAPSTRVF
jgi:hypothetical protein